MVCMGHLLFVALGFGFGGCRVCLSHDEPLGEELTDEIAATQDAAGLLSGESSLNFSVESLRQLV